MTVLLGDPDGIVVEAPDGDGGTTVWFGLDPTWTGWDGSVWHLSRPGSPVILLRGGTRGLSMPPHTRQTSRSPALAGSRFLGSLTDEREVFWPLLVHSAGGSHQWVAADRKFWRSMHPDRPGVWSVTLPDGEQRSLACRFANDGSHAFDMLPVKVGWTTYGVTLIAERPFWQGDPTVVSWSDEISSKPSFPAAGASYVLHLKSGNTLAKATVTNPGDVESFPVWRCTGPFDSVEVGVDGRTIEVPFSLESGEWVDIDTDPEVFTATREDGTDVSALLGETDWAAVPAGESVPLSLLMVGSGSVRMTLPSLYLRAW